MKSERLLSHAAALLTAAPLWFSVTTLCAASEPPLPVHEMRAAIYTKAFAERFGRPAPEPGSEPSAGVQAIEFLVEPSPVLPIYVCYLTVYVDNKLPIAYPEGEVGLRNLPRRPSLLWDRTEEPTRPWTDADRAHLNKRSIRWSRAAFLASPDFVWPKSGWRFGVHYEEYHRDLFPGLAYLKINIGCTTGRPVGTPKKAVELWLKREGGNDYSRVVKVDPNDFLKFPIPQVFVNRILELAAIADERNQRTSNAWKGVPKK